jgi:hypothetical protein
LLYFFFIFYFFLLFFSKQYLDSLKALPSILQSSQKSLSEELEIRIQEQNVGSGNFENIVAYQLQQRFSMIHPVSLLSSLQSTNLLPSTSSAVETLLANMIRTNNNNNNNDYFSLGKELLQLSFCKRIFVGYKEEIGLLLNTWSLVLVMISHDAHLHVWNLPTHLTTENNNNNHNNNSDSPKPTSKNNNHNNNNLYHHFKRGLVLSAFETLLTQSGHFCFEEDVYAPFDPNLTSIIKKPSNPNNKSNNSIPTTIVAITTAGDNNMKNIAFGKLCETLSLDDFEESRFEGLVK